MSRMLKRGWFVAAVSLTAVAVGCQWSGGRRSSVVTEVLEAPVARGEIAGMVSVLSDPDYNLTVDCVGWADAENKVPMCTDTVFAIFSMTKTFTGCALMVAVDRGLIRLEDPVAKYLPEFAAVANRITIRDCMCHVTGIDGGDSEMVHSPVPVREQAKALAKNGKCARKVGQAFRYGNASVNTAAACLEVAAGMPYEEFLRQNVLEPLGMKDTTFVPDADQLRRLVKAYTTTGGPFRPAADYCSGQLKFPADRPVCPMPAAGLYSTPADMIRFSQMLAHHGERKGVRIVSRKTFDEVWAVKQTPKHIPEPYTVGAWLYGDWFGHEGAMRTDQRANLKTGHARVFFIQTENAAGKVFFDVKEKWNVACDQYQGMDLPFSEDMVRTVENDRNEHKEYIADARLSGFSNSCCEKDEMFGWEKRMGHWCRPLTHWTWPGEEGRTVEYVVESDCPQAEIHLNGKQVGETLTAVNLGGVNRFSWKIPYEPGLIQIFGLVDGEPKVDRGVRTAEKPVSVRLFPLKKTGTVYAVRVYVEDRNGVKHPTDARTVQLNVEGPATVEPATVTLKDGCASACVRRTGKGEIRLTGLADGLEPMVVTYGKVVPEKTEKSFTLASVNFRAAGGYDPTPMFWLERAPRIVEVIENRGYDIIGMQEPEHVWCDRIVELLPGWKCLYRGREADGEGESASLLWNDARFELVKDGNFWLSEEPDVPGSKSWKTSCPRTCTWGRFRDRKTGKEFLLFNTHLDCSSFLARSKGMRVLLDRMMSIRAEEGVPAVLMGDLNISMWPGYMPIDESHPLVMAHKILKENWDVSETPHTGPVESYTGFRPIDRAYEAANKAKPPSERCLKGQIDHLLVTDGLRVLTSGTADDCPQGLRVSDHYSLFSDIEIK